MSTTSVEDDQALADLYASLGFSRAVTSAPDPSTRDGLFRALNPFAGSTDSRVQDAVKQKR